MKKAFWSPHATLMTSILMTRGYLLAASADRSMPFPRPNMSSANPALAPSELLLLLGLRLCGMRTCVHRLQLRQQQAPSRDLLLQVLNAPQVPPLSICAIPPWLRAQQPCAELQLASSSMLHPQLAPSSARPTASRRT